MRAVPGWIVALAAAQAVLAGNIELSAPASAGRYETAEFTVRIEPPPSGNPFTQVELIGRFTPPGGAIVSVPGFADAQDGSLFRLRFCPARVGEYAYEVRLRGPGLDRVFTGRLRCARSDRAGPVLVDPHHRKHFIYAGSGQPFYHLGYTAYHLLDPSNDDARIDALIDYCAANGFNKIRFLLSGYPRDSRGPTSQPAEYGVADPTRLPNYGARPGRVNPLPAWVGEPHHYDFTRFNVAYWQRVDRAVRRMAEKGIVATCIVTIEKQNLPGEYGRLTEAEYRLYRYAIARLAAFDNVWWDLGNEHNEYRDVAWGNAMGAFVKKTDPFIRLASAHAYSDFLYSDAAWADFIITQQYGQPREAYDWALKYARVPKPYVNEEHGYEGDDDKPGHGQNADRVRRVHWSIAMAGGYATYGDHSGGVAWFYMGEPGPGKAAGQLRHLRHFFEALPFREMKPESSLSSRGFALVKPAECAVVYLPDGGQTELRLQDADRQSPERKRGIDREPTRPSPAARRLKWTARWFDPRTGDWQNGPALNEPEVPVTAPGPGDWALLLKAQ